MGFSMIFQPFPIAFLHSLGATGRHSPDHARALAEADVLRRLNGGRGRTQCSRPFLGEMMRNHGMLKGLWLYAFFFSPSPSIFWTDFIFKGHLYGILWDFDYGILMDSYGISHDSTLGFYGYPPAICRSLLWLSHDQFGSTIFHRG